MSEVRNELSIAVKRLVRSQASIHSEAEHIAEIIGRFVLANDLEPNDPLVLSLYEEFTESTLLNRAHSWNEASAKLDALLRQTREFVTEADILEAWLDTIGGSPAVIQKIPGTENYRLWPHAEEIGSVNYMYIERLVEAAKVLEGLDVLDVAGDRSQILLTWSEDRFVSEAQFRNLLDEAAKSNFNIAVVRNMERIVDTMSTTNMVFLVHVNDLVENLSSLEDEVNNLIPLGYVTHATATTMHTYDGGMPVNTPYGEGLLFDPSDLEDVDADDEAAADWAEEA